MQLNEENVRYSHYFAECLIKIMSDLKGQEKWSSVRITDAKKSAVKVENHISIHSNLNLNGLEGHGGLGKEVKRAAETELYKLFNL